MKKYLNKINQKNIKNRYIIFGIVLTISIIIVYFLLSSRAYITEKVEGTSQAVVSFSSCSSISYSDSTDSITFTNAYPVSNNVGLNTDPYEFQIANYCEESQEISVYLVINEETDIDLSNIDIYFGNETTEEVKEIKKITDYASTNLADEYTFQYSELTSNDIESVYLLGTYTVSKDEVQDLSLRLWIDKDADVLPNEILNATVVIASNDIVVDEVNTIYYLQQNEVNGIEYSLVDTISSDDVYTKGFSSPSSFDYYGAGIFYYSFDSTLSYCENGSIISSLTDSTIIVEGDSVDTCYAYYSFKRSNETSEDVFYIESIVDGEGNNIDVSFSKNNSELTIMDALDYLEIDLLLVKRAVLTAINSDYFYFFPINLSLELVYSGTIVAENVVVLSHAEGEWYEIDFYNSGYNSLINFNLDDSYENEVLILIIILE